MQNVTTVSIASEVIACFRLSHPHLARLPGLGLQAALGNLADCEVLLQLVNGTLHTQAVIVMISA